MGSVSQEIPLTRRCAQRLKKIAEQPIPAHLKDKATLAILDYLSSIAAGLQAPWAPDVARYAKSKGTGSSYTWATGSSVGAETAAFCNALLAHSAIRDDMHLPSNSHIGSMVISATLAIAQRDGISGENILKAIVAGYEMSALLGSSFQQTEGYNRHIRPSGSCGAFGAAAAAVVAHFSDYDEDVATNALAFAANMASGFNQWAWTGGVEIYTEMGTAASSGITAYDIAQAGLQCSEDVLEGKAGFFVAFNVGSAAASKFTEWLSSSELGRGISEVTFKPVPGCNYAQTPIAAALRASKAFRQKKSQDSKIEVAEILVRSTSAAKNYPGCDNPAKKFETVQQTKMSIQFGVSACLLYGEASEELFKRFDDSAITDLVAKCSITPESTFDEGMKSERRQPASVEVRFSDNTSIKEELRDVPWVSADGVKDRFLTEMRPLTSKGQEDELLVAVAAIDGEPDLSRLLSFFQRR
jgi:2-methylcitrate dehydratase PrpD